MPLKLPPTEAEGYNGDCAESEPSRDGGFVRGAETSLHSGREGKMTSASPSALTYGRISFGSRSARARFAASTTGPSIESQWGGIRLSPFGWLQAPAGPSAGSTGSDSPSATVAARRWRNLATRSEKRIAPPAKKATSPGSRSHWKMTTPL